MSTEPMVQRAAAPAAVDAVRAAHPGAGHEPGDDAHHPGGVQAGDVHHDGRPVAVDLAAAMRTDRAVRAWLDRVEPELVAFRRERHRRPELGWDEYETTAAIVERLRAAGLTPSVLPTGTGLVVDVGSRGPVVGLRADIDALPVQDETSAEQRSTVPGLAHACGHDVHMTVLLGAALALAERHRQAALPGTVRAIFQPAEEVIPGGAHAVIASGALTGMATVYALHCDPTLDVGRLAIRPGGITAASDRLDVSLSGPGGHTARPHLTADLVQALGDVISRVPGLLGRRIDPRSGTALVWGRVEAGHAANVIPQSGLASGTLRTMDRAVWSILPTLVTQLVREVCAPYGVVPEVTYQSGVPPVINDRLCTERFVHAVDAVLGHGSVGPTAQSLGGEDFGWYLEHVPGALARLGVRRPGDEGAGDLHRGTFDPDERSIGYGVRALVPLALEALRSG